MMTQTERSANYAKQNQLKIECRRLARTIPLFDCCEFCDSTEQLQRHHFAGYKLWYIFVTACKQCHEYADKKQHKDTQVLAYEKAQLKQRNYMKNMGYHGVYLNGQLIEVRDKEGNKIIC
jgi:hypothetical protein